MKKWMTMDPGAAALLEELHRGGYKAYVVGGCVRDSLLGRAPQDWDLCTSALPQQVQALVGADRCIPTGLRHGTLTVRAGAGLYEVTTFRVEGEYSDGRRPDRVEFVPDLVRDLARRDFTINAMAYNEEEGLIDPFGGREDLLVRRLVRAVGDPARRFEEDGLRIVRLYRFAAREQLEVEPATGAAALRLCRRLECVSAERLSAELLKLLAAPRPGRWMEPEILGLLLPELAPAAYPDRYALSLRAVDAAPADPAIRLAALFSPLAEPEQAAEMAGRALRRLRCSGALTGRVTALVAGSRLTPAAPDRLRRQARGLLACMEPQTLRDLLALRLAQAETGAGADPAGLRALAAEAEALLKEKACCRLDQLAVGGRDLIRLGYAPGPGLGKALDALLAGVLDDELPNTRPALLWAAEKMLAESSAEKEAVP